MTWRPRGNSVLCKMRVQPHKPLAWKPASGVSGQMHIQCKCRDINMLMVCLSIYACALVAEGAGGGRIIYDLSSKPEIEEWCRTRRRGGCKRMDAMQQEPLEGIQMKADILPDGWWGEEMKQGKRRARFSNPARSLPEKKNRSLAMKRCCLEVIDFLKHCRFGIQKKSTPLFLGAHNGELQEIPEGPEDSGRNKPVPRSPTCLG